MILLWTCFELQITPHSYKTNILRFVLPLQRLLNLNLPDKIIIYITIAAKYSTFSLCRLNAYSWRVVQKYMKAISFRFFSNGDKRRCPSEIHQWTILLPLNLPSTFTLIEENRENSTHCFVEAVGVHCFNHVTDRRVYTTCKKSQISQINNKYTGSL